MSTLSRFLQFCLGGCRHENTIRERRPLHGVEVLHFVCDTCGHAVPAIERTAEEHRHIVEAGAIRPLRMQRAPMGLVKLDSRRAQRRAS